MSNINNPFKGIGQVLEGDVDDLITYLAVIPDEAILVRMWERSIAKQMAKLKHLTALYDFREHFVEPVDKNTITGEIMRVSRRIASDIGEVKDALGINLSTEFIDTWAWEFTYRQHNPVLLKAIAGDKPKIGGHLLRVLSDQQIEFLYNELTREHKLGGGYRVRFIEGDFKDFKEMFTGKGIDPGSFKRIKWVDSTKQTFRQLIWGENPIELNLNSDHVSTPGIKSDNLKEDEIPKVAITFFEYKNKPFVTKPIKKDLSKPSYAKKIEEMNRILNELATM